MKNFSLALVSLVLSSQVFADNASITYGVDKMPVDGLKIEIAIVDAGSGSFDVTHTESYRSWTNGKVVSKTTEIGKGMSCSFNAGHTNCEKNELKGDGPLTQLDIVQDQSKKWAAILTTSFYIWGSADPVTGVPKTSKEMKVLGTELEVLAN